VVTKRNAGQSRVLENEVLKKIDMLIHDIIHDNVSEVKGKFYHLLRGFLKEFFQLNYEFTTKELEKDLGKVSYINDEQKKELVELSNKLDENQYSPDGFTDEELKAMIQRLRDIIVSLMEGEISEGTRQKNPVDNLIITTYHKFTKLMLKTKKKEERTAYEYIYKGYESLLHGEFGLAHEQAKRLLKLYATLKPPFNKKIYPHIMELNKRIGESETNERIRSIDVRFDKAYLVLKAGKIDDAKEHYRAAQRLYSTLNEKDKLLVYKNLQKIFAALKIAELDRRKEDLKKKIANVQSILKEGQIESARSHYDELDELFNKIPESSQKHFKKRLDGLYFELYSDVRS
jgi:hypothetical protein